jgi:hypothetical protein
MATATASRPTKLTIQLRKNIKKEQVNALFDRIYRLSGCLGCGLLGFDLQLISDSVINPIVNDLNDAKLDGIAAVSQRQY